MRDGQVVNGLSLRVARNCGNPHMGLQIAPKHLMGREIERKYLVKDESWRQHAGRGIHYQQGYLCLDMERSVRVRVGGGKGTITLKGKPEGAARDEFEYPIPADDGRQILERICVKPIIEKIRYEIRVGGLKWEVDEFFGENRGLVVAEIETGKLSGEIAKPDWVGEEVTDDPRYFNLNLVKQPYLQWQQPVGN